MKEMAQDFLKAFWVDGLVICVVTLGAAMLGISVIKLGIIILGASAIRTLVKIIKQ